MPKSNLPVATIVGALVGLVVGLLMSASFGALVFAGFGAIMGVLVGVFAANIVPFDFSKLQGNAVVAALHIAKINTTAQVDDFEVSNTRLAKVFTPLLGLGLVAMFMVMHASITAPRQTLGEIAAPALSSAVEDYASGVDVTPSKPVNSK